MSSLPRIYYRVELLYAAGRVKAVSVQGYRPTAHRAAARLLAWEKAEAYQLRRVRDGRVIAHRVQQMEGES